MSSIETSDKRLRSWPREHDAELQLSLRVTLSGVLTLMVSHLSHLRYPLWAVLTAVLLTQLNVGRSLKATTDYLAGTLGGAIFAGAVGMPASMPSRWNACTIAPPICAPGPILVRCCGHWAGCAMILR
jgi:hypothetical protein